MVEERYRKFLVDDVGVDKVRHSGRDFYTHLKGTHDLLEKWGNQPSVCAAGLFHSIYGTRIFRHSAWPIDRRDAIRGLIGNEAELLAYIFCVTDRPKAFLANVGAARIAMRDYHTNAVLLISRPQLRDLLEIEAANSLEQGGNNASCLRQLLATDISAAAKRDLSLCLETAPDANPGSARIGPTVGSLPGLAREDGRKRPYDPAIHRFARGEFQLRRGWTRGSSPRVTPDESR